MPLTLKNFYVQARTQTFTFQDISNTGQFFSIGVSWNIIKVEFVWTLIGPSSASTWADAWITICNKADNSFDTFFAKLWQIWQNWSYYPDDYDGNKFVYKNWTTEYKLFYQKTPAATWTYNVDFIVDKHWVYITTWTNYSEHIRTSWETADVDIIFNAIKYVKIATTNGQWINNSAIITYT